MEAETVENLSGNCFIIPSDFVWVRYEYQTSVIKNVL